MDNKVTEAVDMAIEALEERTEAVTDCISRERAIEIVKRAETKEIAYVALINLDPKEIPTCNECRLPKCLADKQNDWIPVSDRLPEARESVIFSTKEWTGEGCYWETTKHHVIWKGYRWNSTYWDDEVIAWKPIPKPYKESEE